MSVATVRPNETIDLGGATVNGAADAHTATSDDSDSTSVSLAGAQTTLGFAEPTIPGGAVLTLVYVRTRTEGTGGPALVSIPTEGDGQSQTITWLNPTTTTSAIFSFDDATPFNVADVELSLVRFGGTTLILYEAFLDFIYVEQPVVTVTAPTGTLTEDNLPAVAWDRTLDADGGAQTRFEVKVFDAATFGDFSTVDPDVSSPFTESGEVASSADSYQVEEVLPNDGYRVYVRIAQTVNGALHWSEWDLEAFTMDTDAPGDPTVVLTSQPNCGRMRIDLDNTAGAIATQGYQVQRSDDAGVTWANIRTVDGDGLITDLDGGGAAIATDAEAPNGVAVEYRARAVHFFAEGNAYSGWTEDTDTWTSTEAWLKNAHDPTLNMVVSVYSQPSERDASRVGVHNVLGRSDPIVTSDTPGPKTGELVFDLTTAAEQAAFDALRDSVSPLLLQMPAGHHWPDRWLVFTGDRERARYVDKLEVEDRLDSVPWTEVARPNGNLLAWPNPTCA